MIKGMILILILLTFRSLMAMSLDVPLMVYIHLSNVLTDHFSNYLPEQATKDIRLKFSQCPLKNIFNRLPLSNRGIFLQIIRVRRNAVFTFYDTCIACAYNIKFQIGYFT